MLSIALLVITIAAALYLSIAIVRLMQFASVPQLYVEDEFAPSVTILKPIAGAEPELYENLATFCDQDYPDYEIVFCLHSSDDPARTIVERLVNEYPNAKPRIAIGHNAAMANPKIANLAKPGAEPNGEIVVIADSDVRVDRRYLRALCSDFASEAIGAVTCLYRAMPNGGIVSRLGAAHVEDEFAPSVLVALALGPLKFCMGASMAVRRGVLEAFGGLTALGPYLADDHAFGELTCERGHTVALARYVVATAIPENEFDDLWSHELRWARTNRAQAPAGYFFSFVMYALPFAFLYLLVSRNLAVGVGLIAAVAALRCGLHAVARRALGVRRRPDWWLIPLRDVMSLGIWATSLFGRSVRWRTLRTGVTSDGRLIA